MIALRLTLNGNHCCTAGAKDLEVLTAIIGVAGKLGPETVAISAFGKPRVQLSVRGLTGRNNAKDDAHLHWATPSVGIGDLLTIEIVETRRTDDAHSVEKIRPAMRRGERARRTPSKKPNR